MLSRIKILNRTQTPNSTHNLVRLFSKQNRTLSQAEKIRMEELRRIRRQHLDQENQENSEPLNDPIFSQKDRTRPEDEFPEHNSSKVDQAKQKLSEKEARTDESLADLLKDPQNKRNFVKNMFRYANGFLVACAISWIIYRLIDLGENGRLERIDRVKSWFGLGYSSEVQARQEKLQQENDMKENLYREVEFLKKMNSEYVRSQEKQIVQENGIVKE